VERLPLPTVSIVDRATALEAVDAPGVRAAASRPSMMLAVLPILVPLVVLSPALWNGFVWDDYYNIVSNPNYRGFAPEQLRWMLTNTLLSHWIPVTWLTFGLDYLVWGMQPVGYHLTNLLLHAANAGLVAVIARRLIVLAAPEGGQAAALVGATAASLFFSIHPLRAESVAWVTERRDVLSGLFFLIAVLAYLRAHESRRARQGRWLALSIASFQLGVLAKSIVVTLPAILMILDLYPLRRLDIHPRRWLSAANRRVLLEKLPFLPLAAIGSFVATSVIGRANEFTPLSLVERLTISAYSFWFYAWTTLVPLGLSPLYELPTRIDPRDARFLVASIGIATLLLLFVAFARRWPSGLAAWLAYLVVVAPVSGMTHTGVQLVADRYSYLSCLPWAILFGGGVCATLRVYAAGVLSARWCRVALTIVTVWLAAFAVLSARQVMIWRDPQTLWSHATALDPACFVCQHNVGAALVQQGATAAGIDHLERAVALRPQAPSPRGALVFAYLNTGQPEKAEAQLQALEHSDPDLARDMSALFILAW
jgi:protein O-mannosyl-transferase